MQNFHKKLHEEPFIKNCLVSSTCCTFIDFSSCIAPKPKGSIQQVLCRTQEHSRKSLQVEHFGEAKWNISSVSIPLLRSQIELCSDPFDAPLLTFFCGSKVLNSYKHRKKGSTSNPGGLLIFFFFFFPEGTFKAFYIEPLLWWNLSCVLKLLFDMPFLHNTNNLRKKGPIQ